MGVDINRRVIGGDNGTEWTIQNNIQSAIRNVGNTQNSSYITTAWQKYAKDGSDLLWQFRFQFNSTFGTAGSITLIKLPVWFGTQLTINSSIAFPSGVSGLTRDNPWWDVGVFLTGGGAANWSITWAAGALASGSDYQHVKFMNNGGASLTDTLCILNTSLNAIDLRIPILEWR